MPYYKCIYKKTKGLETLELAQIPKLSEQCPRMDEYFAEGTVICTIEVEANNLDKAWNEAKQLLFMLYKVQL